MIRHISSISKSFSHLLFPENCIHCETELVAKESFICTKCKTNLSLTFFENYTEPTKMDKLFWGKISIHKTFALYYFEDKTVVQSILHTLKYKNNQQIGRQFGRKIGEKISKIYDFNDIEALLPVPMFPKKKFSRGYNQAEILAQGISEILKVPVQQTQVNKLKDTISQTKKSMLERWESSEKNFSSILNNTSYRHIAIVDDVVTTGATFESLVKVIHAKNPELKISLITLAITK
ncbi:MAG: ComF family protein [Bacteroidetes bacterium]|nr:ComF family protein [Bacteroidota bacterium]